MNIQDSTKIAIKHSLTMTRKKWKESHQARVLPTNDSFLQCVITSRDGKQITRYWQPSADDLVADDWEVINPIKDRELLKQF